MPQRTVGSSVVMLFSLLDMTGKYCTDGAVLKLYALTHNNSTHHGGLLKYTFVERSLSLVIS